MKAIFSPGPSYSDPKVREVAGWVRILDLYREALEELGYSVFIPQVPPELIDQSSTVSKITSYDLVAASQLPLDADLFLGPPGYSLAQLYRVLGPRKHGAQIMMEKQWMSTYEYPGLEQRLRHLHPRILIFLFNNSDEWRDQQLAPEYKRFNQPYDLSPTWRWINNRACELADHIIAPSPFVKKTWAKVVPENKISIAFWGVDSPLFSPPLEEPPGFRVLFVGGDPIRKGIIYLLEALKGDTDVALRPYELWIVGCAPLRGAPPHWKQFGLVAHREMPNLYRQCSVLVCPTLEDGIALCVQEAMASGVVPVATEDPAEVFKDGVSGIKIPYRDPQAIKEAVTMLRDNPERRRAMAKAARALAGTQTWARTKEDFKEVVRRVMTGDPLSFEGEMPWRN